MGEGDQGSGIEREPMSARPKEIRPGAGATARLTKHVPARRCEALCERLRELICSCDKLPDVEELFKW
jgi:hypothetical protein